MSEKEDLVKIVVLGPAESGKSSIADFLAGIRDGPPSEYRPTVGCRILRFTRENLRIFDTKRKATIPIRRANVELWDVSGNTRFETCWEAIRDGTDGILFVFNPEGKGSEKDLDPWFKNFAVPLGLKLEQQCMILAHRTTSGPKQSKIRIPKSLSRIPLAQTSLDFEADILREDFDKLLAACYAIKRDKQEDGILKS
jgi:hypothetical protein